MNSIYEYSNYRSFLKDIFKWLKKENPQFTQKRVMIDLGVSSSGFLSNVLSGMKNLNPAQVEKLTEILNITKAEARFFTALVGYDQARNTNDKQKFYTIIKDIQVQKFKHLEGVELDLFSRWYFVAIRELLSIIRFKDDYKNLSKSLKPTITMKEAREAIYFLEAAGFVARDAQGYYESKDVLVSSNNEIKSSSVVAFQLQMIDVGKQALISTSTIGRDVSAISFCASKELFDRIKKETQEFRKHLLELTEQESLESAAVYQLNMQLFPISNEMIFEHTPLTKLKGRKNK